MPTLPSPPEPIQRQARAAWPLCCLSFLGLCVASCGERAIQVQGAVTLDGKPVGPITLLIFPEGPGHSETVFADEQGSFQVDLKPGMYTVALFETREIK